MVEHGLNLLVQFVSMDWIRCGNVLVDQNFGANKLSLGDLPHHVGALGGRYAGRGELRNFVQDIQRVLPPGGVPVQHSGQISFGWNFVGGVGQDVAVNFFRAGRVAQRQNPSPAHLHSLVLLQILHRINRGLRLIQRLAETIVVSLMKILPGIIT